MENSTPAEIEELIHKLNTMTYALLRAKDLALALRDFSCVSEIEGMTIMVRGLDAISANFVEISKTAMQGKKDIFHTIRSISKRMRETKT